MLSNYRRRSRAMVRAAGTPVAGAMVARTARTLVAAAKKLAPYARAAGAKSTLQRKLLGAGKLKSVRRQAKAISSTSAGGSLENTVKSIRTRAKKAGPMKLIMACMEAQYYRTQGLTQYDTASGFYPIANRSSTAGLVSLPVHVWDITACENNVGGVATKPVAGYALYNTSAGNAEIYQLANQFADGTTNSAGTWQVENLSTNSVNSMNFRKAFHDFTHFKANLYGCKNRATRWKIELVMVKDTLADFINANATNINKRKLYDYLSRPFMFNNLNNGDPLTAADIKILKSYTCIIDPGSTDQTTNVPRIHTVNWFIRHNRIRRYDWRRDAPPLPGDNAAFDEEDQSGHDIRVDPRFRLYVVIRALSPSRRTGIASGPELFTLAADTLTEPSYDCVIRNKFLKPE